LDARGTTTRTIDQTKPVTTARARVRWTRVPVVPNMTLPRRRIIETRRDGSMARSRWPSSFSYVVSLAGTPLKRALPRARMV
jgi:hypothetical protein